jgi:hypothetical protein
VLRTASRTYGVSDVRRLGRTASRTYGVSDVRRLGRTAYGDPAGGHAMARRPRDGPRRTAVPGTSYRVRRPRLARQGAVDPFVGRSRPAFVVDGIAGCGRGPCGPDRRAGARPHRSSTAPPPFPPLPITTQVPDTGHCSIVVAVYGSKWRPPESAYAVRSTSGTVVGRRPSRKQPVHLGIHPKSPYAVRTTPYAVCRTHHAVCSSAVRSTPFTSGFDR